MKNHKNHKDHKDHKKPAMEHKWTTLLAMAVLSFVAMYALMYAMVDKLDNVIPNLNQFYMAALMTAPMMVIEVALMGSMYSRRVVMATAAISVMVGVAAWFGIRGQVGIEDKEFLRSMISHHGAAVLMCEAAPIEDAEVIDLCAGIISSQQSEIDWMHTKLSTLE